jgi:hypothetical protein
MGNRVYDDSGAIRRAVQRLVDERRVRLTLHAKHDHPELSEEDKVAMVRNGAGDRLDSKRPSEDGVYVCWARHPEHGLCRIVYAIEEADDGLRLVIITAFRE